MTDLTYSITANHWVQGGGSAGIEIHGIRFGTSDEDVLAMVAEAWRAQELAKTPPKEAPKEKLPDFYAIAAKRILDETNFTTEEKAEFKTICLNLDKDPKKALICAQEDGCTSYDEFIAHVAGTMPDNAKARLAIAK